MSRYALAGAAADELISILDPSDAGDNRLLWAHYCYHHDIGIIMDKAYECAARQHQHEINNAVTTFQKWLTAAFAED